jgi:hypothetical protein
VADRLGAGEGSWTGLHDPVVVRRGSLSGWGWGLKAYRIIAPRLHR